MREAETVGIHIGDLPPAYQAQVLQKWAERERGRKCPSSSCLNDGQGKSAKYHNKPTERVTDSGAVLRFDSQKEARRYDELAALERAGKIRELRMQVDFTLQEAYTDGEGRRVRAIRYRADFTYQKLVTERYVTDGGGSYEYCDEWKPVVEDVKSCATKTKTYAMKRKMMKERYIIDIQQV